MSNMTRIGIMQGRLVPPINDRIQAFPRDSWADEFSRAAQAGLDCIEWIYESYGADNNPIATADGIGKLRHLVEEHGVTMHSLCADYFIEFPLVRVAQSEVAQRLEKLIWLLGQCHTMGVERIVLPFVDNSAMRTEDDKADMISTLKIAMPHAERHNVELHLETDLNPDDFEDLLERVPHSLLKVNYDSGNSASLGYRPQDEFAAYGERIGSVHIKDRLQGGTTVPLATGDADLSAVFDGLKALNYKGDYILQVARGRSGDEVALAKKNLAFVRQHL